MSMKQEGLIIIGPTAIGKTGIITDNPLNLPFVRETYEIENLPFKRGSKGIIIK